MQAVRCKSCECLNRVGSLVCRACGEQLPETPQQVGNPAQAPGAPPRILKPAKPSPLRPTADLSKLPPPSAPAPVPLSTDELAIPTIETAPPAAVVAETAVDTIPEAPAEVSLERTAFAPPPPSAVSARETTEAIRAEPATETDLGAEASAETAAGGAMDESVTAEPASVESAPPASSAAVPATPRRVVETPPRPIAPRRAPARVQGALRTDQREVTSPPRLLLAQLIDATLAGTAASAAAYFVAPTVDSAELATTGPLQIVELVLLNPLLMVVFALAAITASALHHAAAVPALRGTIGDRIAGLMLISTSTGRPPRRALAALRGAIAAATALPFAAGPLYALWLQAFRKSPADLVARTALVRREGAGR